MGDGDVCVVEMKKHDGEGGEEEGRRTIVDASSAKSTFRSG